MFRALSIVPALVLVVGALMSSPAQAKGIIVYHSGPDYYPTGPIPEPFNQVEELAPFQAAYTCETFGLFWANIAWWDCQPILLNEAAESYLTLDDVPPELAEAVRARYTEADMQMGGWKKYGRWLFLLLIIGFIAAKVMGSREEAEGMPAGEPPPG